MTHRDINLNLPVSHMLCFSNIIVAADKIWGPRPHNHNPPTNVSLVESRRVTHACDFWGHILCSLESTLRPALMPA